MRAKLEGEQNKSFVSTKKEECCRDEVFSLFRGGFAYQG